MTDAPFDILKLRRFLVSFAAEFEQAGLQRTPATRQELRDLIDQHANKLQAMAIEALIPMDVARWLNIWKILRSIDRYELHNAGVEYIATDDGWDYFRGNPAASLALMRDEDRAKVWVIVVVRGG